MGMPTLPQIQSWDVEHLVSAADHWAGAADRWESAFTEMHQQAHTVTWEGAGATAMRERVTSDKTAVTQKAAQLREAAAVARRGASDISAAQRRVMYAVQDAQNAGFRVEDDLTVIDTRPFQNTAQRAARRAQAQTFAASIQSQVAELAGLDNEVAAGITTAAGDIGVPAFAKPGHVQAVDNTVCNDPDYSSGIERRLWGSVLGGAALGGLAGAPEGGVGAIPGAIIGGASAGILDIIHETQGDGPKCHE
jgi:hypothetical protein